MQTTVPSLCMLLNISVSSDSELDVFAVDGKVEIPAESVDGVSAGNGGWVGGLLIE